MNTQISRLLIGAAIVIFGTALLLNALTIIDTSSILQTWWPMLLIVGGIAMLVNDSKNYLWSLAIIIVGVFVQLRALGFYEDINLWQVIWPLVIIGAGISIAMGRSILPQSKVEAGSDDIMAFLGGSDQKNISENFTGSRVTAILGGAKVDLRKVTIKKNATIQLFTLMGGVELVVPRNVIVKNQTNAILGGVENKTDQDVVKNAPVLTIIGDVIMGGVEIKN